MNSPGIAANHDFGFSSYETDNSSLLAGVSWGAVFAGAAGAFSLSLVLFMLGAGLGLTTISPWSGKGMSPAGLGISALLWMSVTQIIASIVGGYLAGRLRVKWVRLHTNEVFFRDTAHGFIAWSIATLGSIVLLIMPVAVMINAGAHAAASATSTVSSGALTGGSDGIGSHSMMPSSMPLSYSNFGYSIDSLFRADPKAKPAATTDNSEVTRIFVTDLIRGELPAQDRTYVAQVVAARTGSSQADAEQRVTTLFTDMLATEADLKQKAKETADAARKATAIASLWMVVALLAGAFSASAAATFGGKLRDKTEWETI